MKLLNYQITILNNEKTQNKKQIQQQREEIANFDYLIQQAKKKDFEMQKKMQDMDAKYDRNTQEQARKHKEEFKVFRNQNQQYINQLLGQHDDKVKYLNE